MRTLAALALLVLATVPLPADAQGAPPVPLLQDGAGDVRASTGSTSLVDASAQYPAADLRSLVITETMPEIILTLQVEDLRPGNEETGADGVQYTVELEHNGRFFLVEARQSLPSLSSSFYLSVMMRDSRDAEWNYMWFDDEQVKADLAANTVAITLPRQLLADAKGSVPFPGRFLDGITVKGANGFHGAFIGIGVTEIPFPANVTDLMPDAGATPGRYAIAVGLPQTGHARLFAREPFRASNGEATTFVYDAQATNIGEAADTFALKASQVPASAALVLPVPVLTLEPGESRSVPVLLTVPFGHEHGSKLEFVLEMHSQSDPTAIGRLLMGVNYLAVPQPAGHHDTVYLHTQIEPTSVAPLSFQNGYMNTLSEDENDAGVPYYSGGGTSLGGSSYSWWDFPLSPSLQMGLDFDLNRTGQLRFSIGSKLPLLQAEVRGFLYASGREGFYLISEVPVQGPNDVLPDTPMVVDVALEISRDADLIPYATGSEMRLIIELETPSPTGFLEYSPYIAPGGFMQLPLLEYHDPVDEALASLGGPGLSPLGAQERLVNPGEAAVFLVSIANPADDAVTYALEVSGPNRGWASLPAGRLEVPAHATATASLIVRAPPGAPDGERADLVLQAYSTKDPSVRGLLRLVTEVDTEADHPDDTAEAAKLEKKDTPGATLPALVLAVALLAWRRRR